MLVRYQAYEPLVRFTPDWSGVTPTSPRATRSIPRPPNTPSSCARATSGRTASPSPPPTSSSGTTPISPTRRPTSGSNSWWYAGGEPAKLEVVDEQTFKVMFAAPNGFFLQQLAWAQQDQIVRAPKHYLEQFHIQLQSRRRQAGQGAGLESWIALFQREIGFLDDNAFFQNTEPPDAERLDVRRSRPAQNTEQALAVRNPYYFKVDTEGTQLPYFDRIVYQMVADPEVLLLKTLQGEIDMMDQYIATPANKPVLFDGQEAGDYGFYTLKETAANVMVFQLNLNHLDATKRELFNTKEFRQALSIARRPAGADRRGVRRAGRAGAALDHARATRSTTSSWPSSAPSTIPTRPTRCSTRSSRTRTARATGSTSRAGGSSIIFEIDQTRTTFLDMFELAMPMFQAVGIDAQMRTMDRSLWEERVRRGREYDATAHQFGANCRHRGDARRRATSCRSTHNSLLCARPGSSTTPSRTIRHAEEPPAGGQGPAGSLSRARWRPPIRPSSRRHDGADPAERGRPVPRLRRQPAARRLRHRQEQHGQHAEGPCRTRSAGRRPARRVPEQFFKA